MNKLSFKGLHTYEKALSRTEVFVLREQILNTPMLWKGNDRPKDPINTLTKNFSLDDKILVQLQQKLLAIEPKLELHSFQRAGVNLIMPQSNPPYFHTDGESPSTISCLFYINPKTDINEGGETQFDFGDYIIGVKPTPGKLLIFDGDIPHRTTYFRTETRITIFIKYNKNSKIDIFSDD